MGIVDYWCNAFTEERRPMWDAALEEQGLAVKVRRDPADSFASPPAMLARMDEIGVDALLLPSADVSDDAERFAYERYTTPLEDVVKLSGEHPGRFAGLWSVDPGRAMAGVRRAGEALAQPGFVGLHLHTHSFDRGFDHRDLYPFYALAAERDVPVVMQAGASGGLLPSECGRPLGIDRPALFFPEVDFVLSHTGWPWGDEALAMAGKHPNVYLGTAAFPPDHWSDALVHFLSGPGRGKTLFGTSFPVVGHRQALTRLDALDLADEARTALLEGTARHLFTRL